MAKTTSKFSERRESSTRLVEDMLSHLKADFVDYEPNSQVAKFYANRSVFITGATGFIGKVIKVDARVSTTEERERNKTLVNQTLQH